MAIELRQSTAVDVLIGPFLDVTDAKTAETGESPAVKLSKNGQTLGAKSDATTPVHDADGYYNCEFDTTDTNTIGALVLTVVGTASALPVRHEFMVLDEAVYDVKYGTTAPATVSNITAGTITTVTNLTNAPGAGDLTATMKTSVQTAAAAALTAYDPPTNAEMEARTIAAASYGTAANQATIAGYLDTEIAAIKAKTDSLTFTVAGVLDANIQYVNDVEVTGDGQSGTEWGPA